MSIEIKSTFPVIRYDIKDDESVVIMELEGAQILYDTNKSFIFPYGVLKNKSYEGFRNFKFGDKIMEIKMVLESYKPFFDGEEPVVLILQNCGYT